MPKKFKDLFFVQESETSNVQVPVTKIKNEVFTPAAPTAAPVHQVDSTDNAGRVSVEADETMVAQIWDRIIARNLPGPDYLELRNNASALEGLPLSEEQRLEAAFKVLKRTYPTLTKDIILNSIDTYIGVVSEEKEYGLNQCREAREKTIGEKESRIKLMRDTNEEKRRQWNELKKEIDATDATINKMEHEILTAKQEMEHQERAFLASIDSANSVLMSDKAKITTLNF